MSVRRYEDGDGVVLGVDDGDLFGHVAFGNARSFIYQQDAGVVQPLSYNVIQGVMAANQRLAKSFVLSWVQHLQTLVSDFVSVVADVQLNDVPFLGDLVAVLVGGFPVAVEQAPGNQAFVVKTSRASLDVIILNVQIGWSAQSRDHLIQNAAGLLLVGL